MRGSKLDGNRNERLRRDDEAEVKLKETMHEAKAVRTNATKSGGELWAGMIFSGFLYYYYYFFKLQDGNVIGLDTVQATDSRMSTLQS